MVSAVQQEVERRKPLDVAKHTVGLDELVADFESQCGQITEEEKVNIIGISGMAGSGKTTLAKELFNRKRYDYNGSSCFVSDVREVCAKGEMISLQNKILKDLVYESHPYFQSISEGTTYLRRRLESGRHSGRCLIVLDNIDDPEQLDSLLFKDALGSGCLVIVTTCDERVLIRAGITVQYRMKQMERHHATELFCWHAFHQLSPVHRYEDLVERFVQLCGGLPLSLKVLGGHVYGSTRHYWELQLDKVEKMMLGDVTQRLKISYDSLDNEGKQMFLDVACFFIGKPKSMVVIIWKGSGWSAEVGLKNLQDKCLVEVGYEMGYPYGDPILRMHDHLRDLGREIARELRHPRRLWEPQDLISLESKGLQNMLAELNGRCLHSIFDQSFGSKITFFIGESNNFAETSTLLLWLELDLKKSWLESIPSWITLQNLQCLKIVDGYLTRLWQENLQVSCSSWISSPILQCLERGSQKRLCQSDAEVPLQLKELLLDGTVLKEFPNTLGMLNHLETLILKGGYSHISNSTFLEGNGMLIEGRHLSESLRKLSSLRSLILWNFFVRGELDLRNSEGVTSFESSIGRCMNRLQSINIRGVKLTSKVLIGGEICPSLVSLRLDKMENLVEMDLRLLKNLVSLKLMFCRKLKIISGNFDWGNLQTFKIRECEELQEMPSLSRLTCLESITIDQCQKLQNIEGIEDLEGLKYLYVSTGNGGVDVRNCLQRLKRLPSEFTTVIGRAVDGGESALNENFFYNLISPEAVTGFHPMNENRKNEKSVKTPDSLSAIIICALVQSSSEFGQITTPITRWRPFAPGEQIVTIVLTGQKSAYKYHSPDFNLTLVHAELKKKIIVTVNQEEELKALNIFRAIIGQLYQGIP